MFKKINSAAYIFFLLQLPFLKAQAVEIYGRVTAKDGNALAYANVFLKGTNKGTTANLDGYYKLDAAPGNYVVAAKYLGYSQKEKPVTISATATEINFELQPENFQIKEVTIVAGEDPAYAIVKQAIKKRKFYLGQVEAFTCNVYIKGLQKMKAYPKKLMGVKVDFGGQLDSTSGIFYLSESVSKLSYEKPNRISEEMISSRISGNNKAFSFNQASEMMFNFYENIVDAQAISARGFISPIASSALLYYRYELLGTTVENDLLVHKIKVTPGANTILQLKD
ncbi:MAG: carboxypeptidase-like regulatory domain-containing protein [Bacteroidetes bacterium]|nr:carboxypeptidase-like regulatory domain-containing protein [Bacteroidota bacterium]